MALSKKNKIRAALREKAASIAVTVQFLVDIDEAETAGAVAKELATLALDGVLG